jgi:hypothetical protein
MKHALMDPSFPDLIAAAAAAHSAELTFDRAPPRRSAECLNAISELVVMLMAELDIAATRVW